MKFRNLQLTEGQAFDSKLKRPIREKTKQLLRPSVTTGNESYHRIHMKNCH